MRTSPRRHPLAVLRTHLGWHQQEMADKAGISKSAIQAIELGKRKLSDDVAERIALITGVPVESLKGPVTDEPRTVTGQIPDKKMLDSLTTLSAMDEVGSWIARNGLERFSARIGRVIVEAKRRGVVGESILKLHRTISTLEKQFDIPPEAVNGLEHDASALLKQLGSGRDLLKRLADRIPSNRVYISAWAAALFSKFHEAMDDTINVVHFHANYGHPPPLDFRGNWEDRLGLTDLASHKRRQVHRKSRDERMTTRERDATGNQSKSLSKAAAPRPRSDESQARQGTPRSER